MSRSLAVAFAFVCLCCNGDRLRPVDPPDPRLPPPAAPNPTSPQAPPAETPPEEPPQETPCECLATINDGCAVNGRCDAGGACVWDTATNGTTCTTTGLAGECIDRYCIPFDTQTYGTPPPARPPWCPISGVGLPATQPLNPIGGAACAIYGAGQMAFGNCPVETYPMVSFEDTSLATRLQAKFDLRWLKFAGVLSLRVRIPDEPSNLLFALTDYGQNTPGYLVSISDTPCDVGVTSPRFDATHCEGGGPYMAGSVDGPAGAGAPCNQLRSGHIYYFNIYGAGPADPTSDGVIDAGERLLITLQFDRP
ncbi:MAG: hypothetical protein ACAI38_15045 [Myxococcota bacterium]